MPPPPSPVSPPPPYSSPGDEMREAFRTTKFSIFLYIGLNETDKGFQQTVFNKLVNFEVLDEAEMEYAIDAHNKYLDAKGDNSKLAKLTRNPEIFLEHVQNASAKRIAKMREEIATLRAMIQELCLSPCAVDWYTPVGYANLRIAELEDKIAKLER